LESCINIKKAAILSRDKYLSVSKKYLASELEKFKSRNVPQIPNVMAAIRAVEITLFFFSVAISLLYKLKLAVPSPAEKIILVISIHKLMISSIPNSEVVRFFAYIGTRIKLAILTKTIPKK
jgi:hypothetical protein